MGNKKKVYEEFRDILDEKLLPIGFERSPERIDERTGSNKYVMYERDYFLLSIVSSSGLLGNPKIEGTGELDLNLFKFNKKKNIKALDKWIAMLNVWLAQNK